jgi:hypothetical protein
MKKTLIAMAAVAVAGVASAQVTITGAMGFGFSDQSTAARTAGFTDGNVTFAASEDLGGGMSISGSFTMDGKGSEGSPSMDGQSLSLTTATAGSLAMGEANAAKDKLGVASLPYSTETLFGGTTAGYTYAQYTLPTIVDGLSVGLRWTGSAGSMATTAAKPQYRFSMSVAGAAIDFNTKPSSTGTASEVAVAYTVEGITLKAFADTAVASGDKRQEYSISAPVGAMTLAASMATKGTLKGTEVNATYALSKRTSLSVNFGSFTGGTDTSANRVKLVHKF